MTSHMYVLAALAACTADFKQVQPPLRTDTATLVQRFGSQEGELVFTRIGGLTIVSSTNNLVIAQPEDGNLRVISPDGRHIRYIGRKGMGPGEFGRVDGIGWRNEQIWAYDGALHRVTYFDSAGVHIRTVGQLSQLPGVLLPLATEMLLIPPLNQALVAKRGGHDLPLSTIRADGSVGDTICFLHFPRSPVVAIDIDGRKMMITQPVRDESLFAIAPTGDWIVTAERPAPRERRASVTITRINLQGDTVWLRTLDLSAEPVPPTLLREYAERLRKNPLIMARTREILAAYEKEVDVPPFYPAIDQLLVALNGNAWVRRMSSGQYAEWLVFSTAGQLTRRVFIPSDVRPLAIANENVWGVQHDSLDIPHLLRLALPAR